MKLQAAPKTSGSGFKVRLKPLAAFLDYFIFVALLVTIVVTAIPYGTVQPWWIALFTCTVFLIATLAAIEQFLGKPLNRAHILLFTPLLLLTLFIFVQSLPIFSGLGPLGLRQTLSSDAANTQMIAMRLLAVILVSLLVLRYVSSRARLRYLIYTIIGIGLASAIFGLLRTRFPNDALFIPGLTSTERGFAQFVNRNHFAFLVEISLGLSLGLITAAIGHHRRLIVLLTSSAILWVALISSGSRGGMLASLCQLLFLGALVDPFRRLNEHQTGPRSRRVRNLASGVALRIVLAVCLVAVFAIGVRWVGGEPVVFNLQRATTDFSEEEMQNNANTSRKEIWAATWRLIKANPITGVGFGGYWVAITRYHNASGTVTPQEAHNDYLELLASGGLIGAGLIVWFATLFWKRSKERLGSPDPFLRAACLGALTGVFGVAIHSLVDFGLHITINLLALFTLLSIAALDGLPPEQGGKTRTLARRPGR